MKTQKGFTLIELMIVVAIIGILAAVAIPAYSDYLKRSQVAEALGLLAGLKTPTEEWYGSKGTWPTNIAGQLGGKLAGKYTTKIEVDSANKRYTAEMKDASITGQVWLTYDSAKKTWTCYGSTVKAEYLPTACKTQ